MHGEQHVAAVKVRDHAAAHHHHHHMQIGIVKYMLIMSGNIEHMCRNRMSPQKT